MNVVFLFFYIIFFLLIIANAFKVDKVIKNNHYNLLNNVEKMANDIQLKSRLEYGNNSNNIKQESVNLDDFMKSNTNPIKEKRGKRSNI